MKRRNTINRNSRVGTIILSLAAAAALAVGFGCEGRPSLLPNSDKSLNQTSTQFAADAATRHYEADAPSGGPAQCRAEIDYAVGTISLANVSDQDWSNVEVWINQNYVVFVPLIEKQSDKTLYFHMIYDTHGNCYKATTAEGVDLYHDGKMFAAVTQLPDH
jgi:hypothetical protein